MKDISCFTPQDFLREIEVLQKGWQREMSSLEEKSVVLDITHL